MPSPSVGDLSALIFLGERIKASVETRAFFKDKANDTRALARVIEVATEAIDQVEASIIKTAELRIRLYLLTSGKFPLHPAEQPDPGT